MKYRFQKARSKMNSKKVVVDGMRFDSKLEADYYRQLKLRVKAGEVDCFLRQVPFHLPGGVTYKSDFMVFLQTGQVEVIDTKGYLTKEFVRAKKQVEALYPVEIKVVKRGDF